MDALAKRDFFYDTGSIKRERENFQGMQFQEIDLRGKNPPISFRRSDFRGALIVNSYFDSNNFSNADFIDAVISNSQFLKCQFKYTELYNSYFENCNFPNVSFSSASMVRLTYKNCAFPNTRLSISTVRNCKFINADFTNCTFERSSMDEVEFEETSFSNCDLSGMTSMNLYFDKCVFEKVIIDADYLGSYFFKGSLPDNIFLKYRGKKLKLDISQQDLLQSLCRIFFDKGRYYEAINLIVQNNLIKNKRSSILKFIRKSIDSLLHLENPLVRTYQLDKIFKIFEYYFNTGNILIGDYFKFLELTISLQGKLPSAEDELLFYEKINRLQQLLELTPYSNEFIQSGGIPETMLAEVHIEEQDKETFEAHWSRLMQGIAQQLEIEGKPFFVYEIRKGSLIYSIVLYSVAALFLLRLLRKALKEVRIISNESMQIRMDLRTNKILLKQLESSSLEKLDKIRNLRAGGQQIVYETPAIEQDINEMLPLLKQLTLKPNQFPEDSE